jgi:alanine dehydrogenase
VRIGVPKEIKNNEYRVGLIPSSVRSYIEKGHEVVVEAGAGEGSAIPDAQYKKHGATIIDSAEEVWASSDMIVKVKEPVESEYDLIQDNQLLFTYLHLAAEPELTKVLVEKNVSAVAYETIQSDDGSLPVLEPMSEVAGRMAIQVGAKCLEREHGGKGVLLGGVPGTARGNVVIIGGGTVGTNAAKLAVGMGAKTKILDIDLQRLRYLDDIFGSQIETLHSNAETIQKEIQRADLVIGAVLIPGAKAPHLVNREHIGDMPLGSVVVDVSVDQGGCIETCHPTTHESPTYEVDGVIHYCVSNMPGAVARTSTFALNHATLPYGLRLVDQGLEEAVRESRPMELGLNTYRGRVTHEAVAESLEMEYTEPTSLM